MNPLWTDVAQVGILGAQLLFLGIAAFVAWRQVGEAKRLREEQSRPFVVIDFGVENTLIFLSISNVGTSLARDVNFQITPSLVSSIEDSFGDMKMLREGISTLPPGKVIRTLFDSGIHRKDKGLPDTYKVTSRYRDQEGRRQFAEETDLDLGIYWGLVTVDSKGIHDIHERVKEVRDVFRKWTTSTGGILQMSPKELRAENERRTRLMDERRKEREGKQP